LSRDAIEGIENLWGISDSPYMGRRKQSFVMFDLLFVLVVGLSTIFAAMRGGLRELATLLALAMAGGLTWMVAPGALGAIGLADSFFGTIAVSAVLVAVFFIVAHIVLHIGLKQVPLEGRAVLIDRLAGGGFGAFRGLVLVGLGFLGYGYYLDEARQPEEVKTAVTRPIAAGMADWFESFAPEATQIDAGGEPEDETEDTDAAIDGYGRADRNGLEEIVTTVTTTDPELVLEEPEEEATAEARALEDEMADILQETEEQ
jgi:membrane protein required for colicin V production